MANITAKTVMAFRDRTGLPMMDCKRALIEADGDEEKAIEILRKKGIAKMAEKSAERTTEEGVIAIARGEGSVGVAELLCESAPVASNPEFLQLADDIATVVAKNPAFGSVEELMAQPSPSKEGFTLQSQLEELYNRIKEVFRVSRFEKFEGLVSSYLHHDRKTSVLLLLDEGDEAIGRDICMHIAAMRPEGLDENDIDPAVIENEKRIQLEMMNQDPKNAAKPDSIKEKIIMGKMGAFLAGKCLLSQEFVKEPGQTVGEFAKKSGLKIRKFVRWTLGK